MAILGSCPKHNMVTYLEKTDGNIKFHDIISFLMRSSIHYVLTVSPVVSTTFVEQFWMSTKSKLINNVRYITAKVPGKPVSISKASIRSDLLFNDANGIDSFPNQAIVDDIQLMGKVHVEPQSDPSPRPSPTTHIPDSIPEDSGGNHGDQARQIKHLKAQIKKLKKQAKPVISHHKAWVKSVSLKERLAGKKSRVSTDKEEVSIFRPDEGTDDQTKGRYDPQTRPTTTTPSIFGDDETIAQLKDVEETERPRATSTRSLLTLKPLPKIDPKDKGKKKIEEEDESDTESEAEEEVKKLAKEEAIKAALSNEYDFIQARIEADRLLALRLQDEEREQFTMEERAKFLHDTISTQRRFLAEERTIAIRNRPPTRTQLRNQMMTYLNHVENKKHSDLKNKTFEEIQALYEKVKRFDESFTTVGSIEDERKIKEMNEGAKDLKHKRLKKKVVKETSKKEDTAKVPAKVNVTEQGTKKRKGGHMKMIARKRKRPQPDVDSDDEHRKCLKIITFEGNASPDRDYLVIYRANGNFRAFNYLLEGDLKIMMKSSTEENDQSDFWNDQQEWEIVTWRLYKRCGVYILKLKDGKPVHPYVSLKEGIHFPRFYCKMKLDLLDRC
ncbi:hypothetical protein Tco_0143779 [Tanacetum coccineum]